MDNYGSASPNDLTPGENLPTRTETIIASRSVPDQHVMRQPPGLGMGHCGSNRRR